MTIYEQLTTMAKKYKWPELYVHDLTVHDKRTLKEYKPDKFVWVLRQYGTQLVFDKQDSFVIEHEICNGAKFFIFERGNLRRVRRETAQNFALNLKVTS